MVSCLMGDSTALASAIVRCCPSMQLPNYRYNLNKASFICNIHKETATLITQNHRRDMHIEGTQTICLLIDRLDVSANTLFPSKSTIDAETLQHLLGKLQTCNMQNQKMVLNSLNFLVEIG